MLPATFGPMILKLILPKIMDQVGKVFKMNQLINYMELPNSADEKSESNEIRIEALEKIVIDLGKDSHPMQPFEDRITALEKKVGK